MLGLSPDKRLITGYGRKGLYVFSRSGALLSHVEFSKTIADIAWIGDVLYVVEPLHGNQRRARVGAEPDPLPLGRYQSPAVIQRQVSILHGL